MKNRDLGYNIPVHNEPHVILNMLLKDIFKMFIPDPWLAHCHHFDRDSSSPVHFVNRQVQSANFGQRAAQRMSSN